MEPHRSPGLLGESEKRVAGNLEKTVCLIQSWSSQACRLLTEDPPSPPSTPVLCSHLQGGDSSPHILTQSPRGHYCTVTEDFPPFSRGSSQPRDWTQVSHTAGGFFTNWATGHFNTQKVKRMWTEGLNICMFLRTCFVFIYYLPLTVLFIIHSPWGGGDSGEEQTEKPRRCKNLTQEPFEFPDQTGCFLHYAFLGHWFLWQRRVI